MDIGQIRKLSPKTGDVFVVPSNTPVETVEAFIEGLCMATPGIKAMVFRGELQQLDVADMNAAGWYRA
ncbi:hypothetical protein [Pseudomonas sp. Marseille-Q5115]|uniref:hypothetical protein n=1 Tax=Pseudomonas sp. Marseille-Q5115 TaxID=2866593 RepID=UPI001CE40D1A|nr:hypothetical protein [Pseudomonas sp. Marseille-Q5115]